MESGDAAEAAADAAAAAAVLSELAGEMLLFEDSLDECYVSKTFCDQRQSWIAKVCLGRDHGLYADKVGVSDAVAMAQALKYFYEHVKKGRKPGAPPGMVDWPRGKEWQKALKALAAIPDPFARIKPSRALRRPRRCS